MGAFSTYSQDCHSDPVETLTYAPSSTASHSIAIHRYDASGISNFDLYTFSHTLEYQTAAGRLLEPADNASAMTVGAVPCYGASGIE